MSLDSKYTVLLIIGILAGTYLTTLYCNSSYSSEIVCSAISDITGFQFKGLEEKISQNN